MGFSVQCALGCCLSSSHSLRERTFSTLEFYRKHQDSMTPAGLAFFQSQWDQSVTKTFHETLSESLHRFLFLNLWHYNEYCVICCVNFRSAGVKEPVFEFIRPPVYHPPQVKYPHKQPLRYLDRYRDGKEHTYGIY